MHAKNRLTNAPLNRTLVPIEVGDTQVDATTKALLRKLDELERVRWNADNEIKAIKTALRIAGVTPDLHPESHGTLALHDQHEMEYIRTEPFKDITLAEACQRILTDYQPNWLTKTQVEYLITRGGYNFSAKDSKNSVDVTLRRLAGDGKCAVERVRGKRGNRYRWISRFPRLEKDEGQMKQ